MPNGSMDADEADEEDGRRVRFRPVQGLRVDERWEERQVRSPPCYPSWTGGPSRLAYYENSRAATNFSMQNCNLVQLILRDHGYERIDTYEHDGWSIFWCTGPIKPEQLARLRPWQRVNKFPQATALTSKLALWTNFARMQRLHGQEAFNFMPDCFVLPDCLAAFESHLTEQLQHPSRSQDVWILKPDDVNSRTKCA